MLGAVNSIAALLGTADRSTNIELVTCVNSGFCGVSLLPGAADLCSSRRAGDRHHHHACRCGYCQQSQVSPTYSHHVFPRPEVGQLDSPAPLCRQVLAWKLIIA